MCISHKSWKDIARRTYVHSCLVVFKNPIIALFPSFSSFPDIYFLCVLLVLIILLDFPILFKSQDLSETRNNLLISSRVRQVTFVLLIQLRWKWSYWLHVTFCLCHVSHRWLLHLYFTLTHHNTYPKFSAVCFKITWKWHEESLLTRFLLTLTLT